MPQTYNITAEYAGQRLDKFLVAQFPDLSRSQIQKMIKSGAVLINNKPTSVHHFLKTGDQITILDTIRAYPSRRPRAESRGEGALPSKSKKVVEAPQPEIIADTPGYLIIDKPAGLLVHQVPGTNEPSLVDWLLKKYPELRKIGEDPARPGIVHRLDREVSGLMVIPKTQNMFDHLKTQFKTRRIKKEYIALVYGQPSKIENEISFNIDRSITGHKMAAVPTSGPELRGRPAVTKFEVLKSLGNYSLLKISPATGRTHQIRVHLNAYGLPVVGDKIYKPKKLKKIMQLDRIFLHASNLEFFDLENKWQSFSLNLPVELENILQRLSGIDKQI